jgi:hypothetical protein
MSHISIYIYIFSYLLLLFNDTASTVPFNEKCQNGWKVHARKKSFMVHSKIPCWDLP